MTIRLKLVRKKEEQVKKIGELMDMYSIKVPSIPSYQYQPMIAGASVINDPRIQATKNLFQMFGLNR